MKTLAAVLAITLVLSNVVWIYFFIDRSVTNTYRESSVEQYRKNFYDLAEVFNLVFEGHEKNTFYSSVRKIEKDYVIKNTKNAVSVNSVVLVFDDGKLAFVKAMDDLTQAEIDSLGL